jgi:hypothetical protein
MADAMKVGFIEAPYAAATGYIAARLGLEIPREFAIDAIVDKGLELSCAAWYDYSE